MAKVDIKNVIIRKDKNVRVIIEKDAKKNRPLFKTSVSSIEQKYRLKHPLLAGIGSIINVAGNYHTFPEYTSKKANDTAIASVWKKVGSYLFDAIGEVDKQLKIK